MTLLSSHLAPIVASYWFVSLTTCHAAIFRLAISSSYDLRGLSGISRAIRLFIGFSFWNFLYTLFRVDLRDPKEPSTPKLGNLQRR